MKAIVTGLERLEKLVKFWKAEVEKQPNSYNVGHLRNAGYSLASFKRIYESQLATLEKYPFLGKR